MLIWVMYDITHPRRLTRMAKICLRAGTYRVQKSVYVGNLNKNQVDQLRLELKDAMEPKTDSVYLFPMNREDFDKANLMGRAFSRAMITDAIRELIL